MTKTITNQLTINFFPCDKTLLMAVKMGSHTVFRMRLTQRGAMALLAPLYDFCFGKTAPDASHHTLV